MKLTAKGMFRKLGYIQENTLNDRFISYKKQYKSSVYCISFDLINKTYEAHYFDPKGCHPQILSPKELVAIYEQIEELGGGFTYECKRNV